METTDRTENTSNTLQIERVGLVRLSSTTHGFVYDQRYVEVNYTKVDNGIEITIPEKFGDFNYLNVLPPGPYFVFITFTNGWVSVTQPWEMKDDSGAIIPVFTIFIE